MKIAILGAGAMGSFFGGVLAENAHAVTLLDIDTEHLDAVRRDGLRLVNGSQDRRAVVMAARELNVAVVHTETLLQLVRLVEARNTDDRLTH